MLAFQQTDTAGACVPAPFCSGFPVTTPLPIFTCACPPAPATPGVIQRNASNSDRFRKAALWFQLAPNWSTHQPVAGPWTVRVHVNQALTPGIRWVGTWVCDVDKATCASVATLGYAARNSQFVAGVNTHEVPLVRTPAVIGPNVTPMVVIVIVRNPLWQLPWVADQLIDTPYVRRHRPIPDVRHYLSQASGSLGYPD